MQRFANYAVRTIALFAAAGVTSLTLFVHAVDRERLSASVATLPSIVAQSHDTAMPSATLDNAQPVNAVFANSQK